MNRSNVVYIGSESAGDPIPGLLAAWLSQYSANTRPLYEADVRRFARWLDKSLLEATRAEVQRYMVYLASARQEGKHANKAGLAPASIVRHVSSISSFLDYCVDEGATASNPAARVRRPTVESAPRIGLTLSESRALLAAAEAHSPRAFTLVLLLLSTGLRISEAINADIDNIDEDGGHAILNVVRKGGGRGRVPLPPAVLVAVRELIGDRTEGPIFEKFRRLNEGDRRMSPRAARHVLVAIAGRAGLGHVHPHRLRHSAATLALKGGADVVRVQRMLGHKRPETTMRYLQGLSDLDDSPAYGLAGQLLTEKSLEE
jgi:integrase/recombinase XerD